VAQHLAAIALLVRDYDEARAYYTGTLGFDLVEDADMGGGKRWLVVRPPGGAGSALLLAKAVGAEQIARIGDQTGGRVFLPVDRRFLARLPALRRTRRGVHRDAAR